jgi:hypothetical protein
MKRRSVLAAVAGAICAFVALQTPPARAAFHLYAASNCQYQTDYIGDYLLQAGDLLNLSSGVGARPRTVTCPIPTQNGQTNVGVTGILVDVNDASSATQIVANACAAPLTASVSRTCGNNSSTGDVFFGATTLSLDLTEVNNTTNNYVFVNVQLPTSQSGSLRGIEVDF